MRETLILPRKESTPRAPGDLTDDQSRAANRAVSLIDAIANQRTIVESTRQSRGIYSLLPRLDERRVNHNVLIDGGRGSGKTSVLLTVLKYWNHMALEKIGKGPVTDFIRKFNCLVRQREDGSEPPPDPGAPSAQKQDAPALETRSPIVLPVPIIDLQPLASSTDLRLFLANSLRQVIDAMTAEKPEKPRWGPDASEWPTSPHSDVRDAWEKFRDVAALGSDHIQLRRARLDTATYAVELEQAESNRQVAGAFHDFIDSLRDAALRSELTRWGDFRPMFVVPIDDADMNPRLGAQLIETVNLLSHDDVAYLITGDTELFLLLLREHLAGGFRHSLRSVDLESEDTTDIGDLIHLRSLADQIYDKHIPKAHRCRIDPLPGWKRVSLLARNLSNVHGEFERLPRGREPAIRKLSYYFDVPERDPDGSTRTGATDRFTDGALPETMRGLEDALEAIEAVRWRAGMMDKPGVSAVAEVARYFWRERLSASLLRGSDRRDLEDVVRLEESELRLDEHSVTTEKFAVQNTRIERDIIPRTLLSGEFDREHRWSMREILDYEFRLRGEAQSGGILLPSGVGAALILATDIAADLSTGTFIGKALSPEEFDNPFVVTSIFIRRQGEYVDFPWPMPDWDSFRDFHIFSRAWSRVARELSRRSRTSARLLDDLVYPFIALVASVWLDRYGAEAGASSTIQERFDAWKPASPEETSPQDQLRELMKTIESELDCTLSFRRDQDFRHWYYNRLILLAAPESGLSLETANLLYDVLRDAPSRIRGTSDPQQRASEFAQTARVARLARMNQARIGGGKQTGTRIRELYSETKLDELLGQIDQGLRRMGDERYPEHISAQAPATEAAPAQQSA
jgi:hypothetical protein